MLNPGPGHYEETGNIGKGAQTCSTFKSPKVKNMGTTEQRSEWSVHSRFATPGPGTYRPPSDFGYLDKQQNAAGGGKDLNSSMMGGISTTEGTSRWEHLNKLATPANMSATGSEKKGGLKFRN